jgi:hypothetical protein
MSIVRPCLLLALAASFAAPIPAATLEQLSMGDMVQKSTDIVRVRVQSSSASLRGIPGRGIIYTRYTVQVLERWKGNAAAQMDVAIPGGAVGNRRQTFPGAPTLNPNGEYVLFLWTSPTGLTQIIGLSQGLVNVTVDASGTSILGRGSISEPMVDASGNSVTDPGFSTTLPSFRTVMRSTYGLGAQQ